jgi:hypothetical protein
MENKYENVWFSAQFVLCAALLVLSLQIVHFTGVLMCWLGGSFAFFCWSVRLAKKQMCHQKRWLMTAHIKFVGELFGFLF